MKFHELQVQRQKSNNRVGRGISAGQGKTAGRGTKGQNSRSGSSRKPGFEGGQNPLSQKLPKLPGFKSHRPKVETVYTGQLDEIKVVTIDNVVLANERFIDHPHSKVKLIFNGDVKNKHTVKLQAASISARKALEKAGGSFESVGQIKRQKKEKPASTEK